MKREFEPGKTYISPYRSPGEAPGGAKWVCVRRHPEKGYPEEWQLRSKSVTGDEPPTIDELAPPGVDFPLYKERLGFPSGKSEGSKNRRPPQTFSAYVSEALEEKED